MIAVLSPAKTLDYEPQTLSFESTLPQFAQESASLIKTLKSKSKKSIQNLMKVSEALAELNVSRYKSFDETFQSDPVKAAIFAFKGDVYQGFDAGSLTKTQIKYADKHVRILSGLYGILKPLDLMQPYRLEMGTKLSTRSGENLYEFWNDKITDSLNAELASHKQQVIINLASNEYFKVIKPKQLKADIIKIKFREYKGDELKFISFNAKRARGLMARYMAQNKLTKPEQLKHFNLENYQYTAEGSSDRELLFIR